MHPTLLYLWAGVLCLVMELFIFKTQEAFKPKMMIVIIWPLFVFWLIMKPFAEREQASILSRVDANSRRIRKRLSQRMSVFEKNQKPKVKEHKKETIPVYAPSRMEAVIDGLDN